MTLRILPELEQRSEEWHDQRRGMVTASAMGRLITPTRVEVADNELSRGLTTMLAAERITGWTDPTYMNDDMWRGVMEEPRAVEHYTEHFAPVTTVGFMVEDKWGYEIGYSPDGLVGDDGLIEVKAPRAKTHLATILADQVPAYHQPQLQTGLLVSGRKWIDFISWCGGMPPFVRRVYPDPRWQEAIVAAVGKFEQNVAQMVATYRAATEGLPMSERVDHDRVELKL